MIAFLVFFSNAMFPALIPTFAREFSVRPFDLKWLVPGFSLAYAFATLVYGVVADELGRIVLLRRLLTFASILILVLSFSATARELVFLRAMSGTATGGIVTICLCVIGDKYPYRVQGRPMGRMFGALATGLGVGVGLGPLVSAWIGWRWALRFVSLGFFALALWLRNEYPQLPFKKLREMKAKEIAKEYLSIVNAPRGKRTLCFITANGMFHGGVFSWLGVYLARTFHLGQAGIGLTLIGYGVPGLLLGARIGSWADTYGRRYVIPAGFVWAGCSVAALAFATKILIVFLAIAALSVGFDATHPMMSSITTSLDPRHRGQVTGMTTFANFMGMAVGSLAFGHALKFGFFEAFLGFALLELILGCVATFAFHNEEPGQTQHRQASSIP